MKHKHAHGKFRAEDFEIPADLIPDGWVRTHEGFKKMTCFAQGSFSD